MDGGDDDELRGRSREVINKVKVGDQITAKVYDGAFKTLPDVQVVPAKNKK